MLIKFSIFMLVLFWNTDCDARGNRRRHRNEHRATEDMNRTDLLLSQAVNDFGVSLYKELFPGRENLVLAPISVLTAMSMVMLGAKGETEQNLFQGLKLQPLRRSRKVHRAFKKYTRSIGGSLQNVTLESANAMFVREGEPITPQYRKKIREFYDAESREFNFTHPQGPEAPINEWIESKTQGMIQDFFSPGSVKGDTLMWLINAVYFKGAWDWGFEKSYTRETPFRTSSGEEVMVDMMHNDFSYSTKYSPELQVRVLELPYLGDRFSLFILLPDTVGLEALMSTLDYDVLEGLLTNLDRPSDFLIFIPKFKLESSLNLKSPLQDLGVSNVFESGSADLSGINGRRNLFVDEVKQEAVLEVNERGTLAAAVTTVVVNTVSGGRTPLIEVNRPFMFVLRDKGTASNLFIGHVSDPSTSN